MEEGQLLRNAHLLHSIPGVIIQGRYDACTPAKTAWELHKAWPQAEFHLVTTPAMLSTNPDILAKLIAATDKFTVFLADCQPKSEKPNAVSAMHPAALTIKKFIWIQK